jgi:hypothetical protein
MYESIVMLLRDVVESVRKQDGCEKQDDPKKRMTLKSRVILKSRMILEIWGAQPKSREVLSTLTSLATELRPRLCFGA